MSSTGSLQNDDEHNKERSSGAAKDAATIREEQQRLNEEKKMTSAALLSLVVEKKEKHSNSTTTMAPAPPHEKAEEANERREKLDNNDLPCDVKIAPVKRHNDRMISEVHLVRVAQLGQTRTSATDHRVHDAAGCERLVGIFFEETAIAFFCLMVLQAKTSLFHSASFCLLLKQDRFIV